MKDYTLPVVLISAFLFTLLDAKQWESNLVRYDQNGKLVYYADSLGNKIPDFSYAGYKNGNEEIPVVPVVKTISPIAGDNTAHIQHAINDVASLPFNSQGIRGALLLSAGMYRVAGTIYINESGIILRGVGEDADSVTNTIIYAIGDTPHQRSVIIAGGGATSRWKEKDPSVGQQNITSDTVPAGSRAFIIANASQYKVGDNIVIYHPCTDAWLKTIDYGGTHSGEPGADSVDVPWKVNSYPIVYNRNITAINGNTITVDVPLFYTLVRNLSQSYIYKYARTNLKTMIGIENLRIDIEANDITSNPNGNENHAWNAIELNQIEDAWIKNCTMLHFGHAGVITNTSTRVTVEKCSALDPVSIITGERRYNFNTYTASQQILFKECRATNGRHHYVSNGTTFASGNVFLDCTSSGAYASSEGHRSWSQGFLWDNHKELDGPRSGLNILLALYNRGYYGTSHGWAIVNSVAWNCDVRTGSLILQRPPMAQNFAIGCKGNVTGLKPPAPFNHPSGYIEGTGEDSLNPRSLYLAQLEDRKKTTKVLEGRNIPNKFQLFQNYPNPFNPTTDVRFSIENFSVVTLKVYDSIGREIATLLDETKEPGSYEVTFDASRLSSGVYFARLDTGTHSQVRAMMLLK